MSLTHSHLWPGVPLAIGSALLFGIATPFSKALLAGILYLGAGAGWAVFHVASQSIGLPSQEAPLRAKDIPWLGAVVLFCGVLRPLLLNLEALATMGIAWLAFGENVDRRLLAGAFAILFGAAVLPWEGAAFPWTPVRFSLRAHAFAGGSTTT